MKIIDLIQGTKEWLDFRSIRITASDSSSIMELNPWCSPIELWKRKLGLLPEVEENAKMKSGSEMEPIAREAFIKETGIHVEPKVVISDTYDWMLASMDGLSNDLKVGVEIKCGARSFKEAKKSYIPGYYKCQMQHQMYICELDWIYYYCFNGKEGILMKLQRDDEFINKIIEQENKFYDCLINLKEPDYYLGEEI